jgi:uncharacterized Tic20 family protein
MTQPPTGPADPSSGQPYQGQPGYPPPGQPYPPQQPGYGQQPPPSYGPPPGPPPPGYASQEDKTWALITHFGAAAGCLLTGGVLSFVAPLIALLTRGNQSPTVREHAKAALNFFIPIAGVAFLLGVMRVCGAFNFGIMGTLIGGLVGLVEFALWVVGLVFGIMAGIKANEGQLYRYPLNLSIIK